MAELSLSDVRNALSTETGLAEVVTMRNNGRPLVAVVNAGVVDHPQTGEPVVAIVSRGNAARLGHLRSRPQMTVAIRRGWQYVTVDGSTELAGPHDTHAAVPADQLPTLLREIYQAAGGTHDDYDEYDRAMVADERCAVFITPERIYGVWR